MNRLVATRLLVPATALFVFLATAPAWAQDETYLPASDAHRAGRWSLQFEVLDNFRLGPFEGAAISATRNSSESSAWRLGLSYFGSFGASSIARAVSTDSGMAVGLPGSQFDNNRASVDVSLLRLKRVNAGNRIGVFFGFGPTASWFRDHAEERVDPSAGFVQSQNSLNRTAFFGLSGLLGTEVFVARAVSLHAQYGTEIGYRSQKQTQQIRTVDSSSGTRILTEREQTFRSHGWLFQPGSVRLGVSVYL
jgi:hypothetical protein